MRGVKGEQNWLNYLNNFYEDIFVDHRMETLILSSFWDVFTFSWDDDYKDKDDWIDI